MLWKIKMAQELHGGLPWLRVLLFGLLAMACLPSTCQSRIVSKEGRALILRFESLTLRPSTRMDPYGRLTIGYGHKINATGNPNFSRKITVPQARQFFYTDIAEAEAAVTRLVKSPASLSQQQFDTLVSYTFSTNATDLQHSKILEAVNRGALSDVPKLVRSANTVHRNGGTIRSNKLRKRRKLETLFWLHGGKRPRRQQKTSSRHANVPTGEFGHAAEQVHLRFSAEDWEGGRRHPLSLRSLLQASRRTPVFFGPFGRNTTANRPGPLPYPYYPATPKPYYYPATPKPYYYPATPKPYYYPATPKPYYYPATPKPYYYPATPKPYYYPATPKPYHYPTTPKPYYYPATPKPYPHYPAGFKPYRPYRRRRPQPAVNPWQHVPAPWLRDRTAPMPTASPWKAQPYPGAGYPWYQNRPRAYVNTPSMPAPAPTARPRYTRHYSARPPPPPTGFPWPHPGNFPVPAYPYTPGWGRRSQQKWQPRLSGPIGSFPWNPRAGQRNTRQRNAASNGARSPWPVFPAPTFPRLPIYGESSPWPYRSARQNLAGNAAWSVPTLPQMGNWPLPYDGSSPRPYITPRQQMSIGGVRTLRPEARFGIRSGYRRPPFNGDWPARPGFTGLPWSKRRHARA